MLDQLRTEIAIVLDGSGSIEPKDFQRAKDFISNMMKEIWQKCLECEFAVVQYGDEIRTEFDLQISRDNPNAALEKVQQIKQLGNVTKTASALQHVLDSIFNENHGSQKTATKKILVLTDGDIFMDPLNLTTVINSAKMENIERFAIGVGKAFEKPKALAELGLIASKGKEHLIKVDDYSALDGLLSSLEQKIIGIEGTKGDALEFDLAEIGFSVHLKDEKSLVFGAVGAFDWSGGLILANTQLDNVKFLNETEENAKMANYGYLGYSVTTIQDPQLYIGGAPRHSNVGKVLVFEKDITTYHLIQKLMGEQLGSYFGSEICSLDVRGDGRLVFLLVAAPFYHVKGEEGRVYVYKLTEENKFSDVDKILEQHSYAFSRFGYAIANIGDINQDGYHDVAIGAPLEGHLENPYSFGSVYIYNSDKHGPRSSPSQRIRSTDLTTRLQYFGQYIDGGLDLTNDGYLDISVGAVNNAVVLRSRPVVKLKANIKVLPEKIPLSSNNILSAHLCFNITPFNSKEFKKSSIHYKLELDIHMDEKRIAFEKDNSGEGKLFPINGNCTDHKLIVLPCNYDCFNSVIIRISYKLISDLKRDLPAPILDIYKDDHTDVELPYVKDCNSKDFCVPNLTLTTHLSGKELVVGHTKDLTIDITLVNTGDDSYLTTLLITYPKNMQFKMIRKTTFSDVKCSDSTALLPLNSSMSCKIGYPVFKKISATFSIIWQIDEVKFPTEQAIIYLNISNSNEHSFPLLQQSVLPVKHSFTAVLTVPTPNIAVNISQDSLQGKYLGYTFNVNGENQFEAPLVLDLQIPITFKDLYNILEVQLIQKMHNTTQCINETRNCKPENNREGKNSAWNFKDFMCLHVQCNFTTAKEEITVTSRLNLATIQKVVTETQELLVTGRIHYDNTLFINLKDADSTAQISILLLKDKEINILPVVIGSSIGGIFLLLLIVLILFKCGFFKRKYKSIGEDS
ncbi:integrin alpha-E [Bombina bombina]|uniref:integrin alpha-E n=1 Tax=Bombina bombina TaxID=8345 RepID=UPI00235A7ED0|nr:integrin alpha-E [Bombina bombina]